MLIPINERAIVNYELVGDNIRKIEEEIRGLIDISMSDNSNSSLCEFFDIKGTVLLYGIPGTGKTSVMHNCMSYALKTYGADCYELFTSSIIESELGKATKNLTSAIQEFEEKKKGILFIDEMDRLCVKRESDEISELKRMLVEVMQFFDRLKLTDKKIVLCCTNVIEQIDSALLRRFTVCEEIRKPSSTDLVKFANVCMEKAGYEGKISGICNDSIKTFDDIKKVFRTSLLLHADIKDSFEMEDI